MPNRGIARPAAVGRSILNIRASTSSFVTSIASEIRKGTVENGRVYASYGNHGQSLPSSSRHVKSLAHEISEYGLPVDEHELDRLDMNHQKYTLLQGNRLFLAPITPTPQKILDLGTGTGTSSEAPVFLTSLRAAQGYLQSISQTCILPQVYLRLPVQLEGDRIADRPR